MALFPLPTPQPLTSFVGGKGSSVPQYGAYLLRHDASNRVYAGSAADVRKRLLTHKSSLKRNCHENPGLQKAFNEDPNVTVEVIFITAERQSAFVVEQQLLDTCRLKGQETFNLATDLQFPRKGAVESELTREKKRQAQLGKTTSEATKQKIRQSSAWRGKPISVEGKVYGSVMDASRSLGLAQSTIYNRCLNVNGSFMDWIYL